MKIGDTVRLNSVSPLMTVESTDETHCRVAWLEEDNAEVHTYSFFPEMLHRSTGDRRLASTAWKDAK